MDSTRISVARLLEADVSLTWQEAVAVVQEVAMVYDVSAAMTDAPPRVTPDACFLTTDGEVDLPEPADREDPRAVGELLRTMLRGLEAPAELTALARRRRGDDLFGDLAAFSIAQRRPAIAALARRALGLAAAPAVVIDTGPVTTTPTVGRDVSGILPTPPAPEPVASDVVNSSAWPPPRLVHVAPDVTRPAVPPAAPPFVATRSAVAVSAPPFRAVDVAVPKPAAGVAAAPASTTESEDELSQLRRRSRGLGAPAPSWSRRLARWVSWRPAFPDPRVVGSSLVILAALFVVWRGAVPALWTPPSPSFESAAATSSPSVPVPTTSPPGAASPQVADTAPNTARSSPVQPPPRRRGAPAAVPLPSAADLAPAVAVPMAAEPAAPPPAAVAVPTNASPPPPSVEPSLPVAPPTPDARTQPPRQSIPERPGASAYYSSGDAGVTPPVMLRQQLPTPLLATDAPIPPGGPYLELLIDEQGVVEQVRLLAPEPSPGQTWYRHRMLLAAAKAWQFVPAQRDGRAVRYAMRLPLEP